MPNGSHCGDLVFLSAVSIITMSRRRDLQTDTRSRLRRTRCRLGLTSLPLTKQLEQISRVEERAFKRKVAECPRCDFQQEIVVLHVRAFFAEDSLL